MKILFITDLYPLTEDEKTTPKTLYNFVKEWEKQGHTVDVIKPNFIFNSILRKKPFYKTGYYGNILNINYLTPFMGSVLSKIKKNQSSFEVETGIDKLSTNANDVYDLTIAHMPSGILFANRLKMPFVAGIHNSDLEVLTSPFYKFYFKKRLEKALCNSKAIACRSYVIKNKLLKLYPEFEQKTFVAPSGIDENIIISSKSYKEDGAVHDELTTNAGKVSTMRILTCANFKKRKNIDKLILACKEIKNIQLTVIGDGKIRKDLEKLDKNVIFTGWLKPQEVYEKMQKNDVFILPSVNETFGMVYLEALANGCITVCTKNDGIDGIIKDSENGFLTEPTINGIKETILKIKQLDESAKNQIVLNGFETVKSMTSAKCAENYLQQIFKIL